MAAPHNTTECGCVPGLAEKTIQKPPSFMFDLLFSNDPPSHSMAVDLKNRLQEVNSFIADAQHEIARTVGAHAEVLERKCKELLLPYKWMYEKVLHPIKRLPSEVWLEIFSECLEVPNVETMNIWLSERSQTCSALETDIGAWALAHVCRRWREIVLNSPKLWRYVSVDSRRYSRYPRRQAVFIAALSYHLRLSRELPITVCVIGGSDPDPLVSMLFSHSSRWEKAYLDLGINAYRTLSSIAKGSFPLLTFVYLEGSMQRGHFWRDVKIDAFQYAPRLKSVKVVLVPEFTQHFSLPWSQLTTYRYQGRTYDGPPEGSDLLEVVRRGLNLEVCKFLRVFDLTPTPGITPTSLTPTQHTNLRQITLTSMHVANIEQYLNLLTFPSLETLSTIIHRPEDDNRSAQSGNDGRAIAQFIERSSCPLHTLTILNWHGMTDEYAIRIFRAAPTIRQLELDYVPPHARAILSALAFNEGSPRLLANLRSLTLNGEAGEGSGSLEPLDEVLLLKMVRSRVFGVVPVLLQEVTLDQFSFEGDAEAGGEAQELFEELSSLVEPKKRESWIMQDHYKHFVF